MALDSIDTFVEQRPGWGSASIVAILIALFVFLWWDAAPKIGDGGSGGGGSGGGTGQGAGDSDQGGTGGGGAGTGQGAGAGTQSGPSGQTPSTQPTSQPSGGGGIPPPPENAKAAAPEPPPVQWESAKKGTASEKEIWEIAKGAVIGKIKSNQPTPKFPDFGAPDTSITAAGGGKFEVKGFFEGGQPGGGVRKIYRFVVIAAPDKSIEVKSIE